MEFWGVEVKSGETVKCDPGERKLLHLSQASLGESKSKGGENVPVFVKFNDQKLVIGTLSGEKYPQIQYDLVFEKEFELSHNSKSTSVFFCGYTTVTPEDPDDDETDSDSESEVEAIQIGQKGANGKPQAKEVKTDVVVEGDGSFAKPKPKKIEAAKKVDIPKADEGGDDDSDDSDEDDSDEDGSDEEMSDAEDGSDDDEDEDEDISEEDVTPAKPEVGKKRATASGSKTPVEKKAKLVTPVGVQKTGGEGKKSVHVATPHPAKHVAKTPAVDGKSKQQTPKSGGSVACKSCAKTFQTDSACQAHFKAKHT